MSTYARVLAREARGLGFETGILYNSLRGLPSSRIAREVAFFDVPPPSVTKPLRVLGQAADLVRDQLGVRATEITLGTVLTQQLGGRWVRCDHVCAARNVFERARGLFALSNRMLRVTLPVEPEVFHWTYPIPARAKAGANIYTIHDLVQFRLPYTTLDWKRYHLRLMRAILRKADHIVTVSENSKHDIMTLFGVEERRITNTYQAVAIPEEVRAKSDAAVAEEVAGFGLEARNYLLFYGSIEPKKNLGRVVECYLGANIKMPLVVVAAQSWLSDDEVRLMNQRFVRRRRKIHFYDYMSWPTLATLIRGARAVVFPSLYEGFGLPVLEGMTLGTPVVSSNQSSVPELAGEAALLVDPYDLEAIRGAIVRIAHDDDLCRHLAAQGVERARKFSLEAYRARLDTLYRSLM